MAGAMASRGRPSKYSEALLPGVQERALAGETDKEIADGIGVSLSTLKLWKTAHPEFSAALKAWKAEADDAVEHSLYRRALSGDTTAMIFWLKNRRKDEWRDRQDHVHSADGDLAALLTSARERSA